MSRRLTLDLGLRFYHTGAIGNVNTGVNGEAAFVRSAYSAANAERIYYPGCTISTLSGSCPAADQYAIDQATGYKTFYSYQGTLVPPSVGGYTGTPTPGPGMVIGGTNGLPLGLYTPPMLSPAPRIGFAWDVFGNGRTAVRGGVRNLHQPRRFQHNQRRDRAGSSHRRGLGVLLERQQHQREPRGPAGQRGGWRADAGVGLRGQPAERVGLQRQPADPAERGLLDGVRGFVGIQPAPPRPRERPHQLHAALRAVQPKLGQPHGAVPARFRRRLAV